MVNRYVVKTSVILTVKPFTDIITYPITVTPKGFISAHREGGDV